MHKSQTSPYVARKTHDLCGIPVNNPWSFKPNLERHLSIQSSRIFPRDLSDAVFVDLSLVNPLFDALGSDQPVNRHIVGLLRPVDSRCRLKPENKKCNIFENLKPVRPVRDSNPVRRWLSDLRRECWVRFHPRATSAPWQRRLLIDWSGWQCSAAWWPGFSHWWNNTRGRSCDTFRQSGRAHKAIGWKSALSASAFSTRRAGKPTPSSYPRATFSESRGTHPLRKPFLRRPRWSKGDLRSIATFAARRSILSRRSSRSKRGIKTEISRTMI